MQWKYTANEMVFPITQPQGSDVFPDTVVRATWKPLACGNVNTFKPFPGYPEKPCP